MLYIDIGLFLLWVECWTCTDEDKCWNIFAKDQMFYVGPLISLIKKKYYYVYSICVSNKNERIFSWKRSSMKLYACPMKLFNPRVFSHLLCCSLEVLDPLRIWALTTIFHHFFHELLFTICDLSCLDEKTQQQRTNNKKQNLFQLFEKLVKTQNLFFVKTCDEQLIIVYKNKNCSLYLRFPVGCQQWLHFFLQFLKNLKKDQP